MAVYFDKKLKQSAGDVSGLYFHATEPVLAVTSYNQSTGGALNLYNKEVCKSHMHWILIFYP